MCAEEQKEMKIEFHSANTDQENLELLLELCVLLIEEQMNTEPCKMKYMST